MKMLNNIKCHSQLIQVGVNDRGRMGISLTESYTTSSLLSLTSETPDASHSCRAQIQLFAFVFYRYTCNNGKKKQFIMEIRGKLTFVKNIT